MDVRSFLLGVLLAGVGLFFTGFLRKAGEDLYAWAKKKIYPKHDEPHSHHLTFHIDGKNPPNIVLGGTEEVKNYPLIERISRVSIDEIRAALDAAPPLQRDQIALNYVGLQVEWDTLFVSGSKHEDKIRLMLKVVDAKHHNHHVWCDVLASEYRDLLILQEGEKIRLSGRIEKVKTSWIDVIDARLHIYENKA